MPSRKRYVLALYQRKTLTRLIVGMSPIITHVHDELMNLNMGWPTTAKTWPERLKKALGKLSGARSTFARRRPVLKLIETRERRGTHTKESPTMAMKRFSVPKPRGLMGKSKKTLLEFTHSFTAPTPAQPPTLVPHPGNPTPENPPAVEAFFHHDEVGG